MNGYFIHTIELSKSISYNEFKKIKDISHCFPKNKGAQNYSWRSTHYKSSGIIIDIHKRTNREMFSGDYDKNYCLKLFVNPSRLIIEDTYTNKIHTFSDFYSAIIKLNDEIMSMFYKYTGIRSVADFKLKRIDITKDIQNIPEHLVQEYILLARRMRHYSGYHINIKLEGKCDRFRKEDSLNLLNKSQGIEFVIYNKHRAAIDMNYKDAIELYADTLRMELRLNRKYIKKIIGKSQGTHLDLIFIYHKMDELAKDVFYNVFFDSSLCYVSDKLLERIIRDKYEKKFSKIIKMFKFAELVRSREGKTIDDALTEMECSYKVEKNLLSYFEKIKLSPLNIHDKNIHFLQSLESLLGISEPSQLEKEYYKLAVKISDDIPFFHRQGNSSTEKDVFARFE